LWRRLTIRMSMMRPQASFLPLIDRGAAVKAMRQPSLEKTRAILRERADAIAKAKNGKGTPVSI